MKVEIRENKGYTFPVLVKDKSSELIVFKISEHAGGLKFSGMVISAPSGSDTNIGYYTDDWSIDSFSLFAGEIVLSNS